MAVGEFKIGFYNPFMITLIQFNKGPFGPLLISIRHFKNNKEIKEIREFRESKEKLTKLTNLLKFSIHFAKKRVCSKEHTPKIFV